MDVGAFCAAFAAVFDRVLADGGFSGWGVLSARTALRRRHDFRRLLAISLAMKNFAVGLFAVAVLYSAPLEVLACSAFVR